MVIWIGQEKMKVISTVVLMIMMIIATVNVSDSPDAAASLAVLLVAEIQSTSRRV